MGLFYQSETGKGKKDRQKSKALPSGRVTRAQSILYMAILEREQVPGRICHETSEDTSNRAPGLRGGALQRANPGGTSLLA